MSHHCRIGKVTYKDRPHLVDIRPAPRGQEIAAVMPKFLDSILGYYARIGIAGCIIVGWGFDGSFSRATRVHKDSGVGVTMLPSFIADILRRDVAENVFHDLMDKKP